MFKRLITPTTTMSIQVMKEIFLHSVEAAQPQRLIQNAVTVTDNHITVKDRSYPLHKPCYIVGFGKAVLGMAIQLEKLLEHRLKMGVVTVPRGSLRQFPVVDSKIKFIEGATNNIPDSDAMKGAMEIKALVESLQQDDLVLVLISGGGSALFPLPKPPITLEEKQHLIKELSLKGADIKELNTVRSQISALKGGGLAQLAYPARVISLILPDIVGDPLQSIASGPTHPTSDDNRNHAFSVLTKYGCQETLPPSIVAVLEEPGSLGALPPIRDGGYEHVDNFMIGNNRIATEAACRYAASLNLQSVILSSQVEGDVGEIGQFYVDLIHKMAAVVADCTSSTKRDLKEFLKEDRGFFVLPLVVQTLLGFDFGEAICIIAGGEPTVVVRGSGRGGRNQQLALEVSVRLNKQNVKSVEVSFLSCGTDGIDGPTDAAGAIGTSDLVNASREQNIKPEDYLNNNDSYNFYKKFNNGDHLITTGHTGTNVMDLHVIIVKPKKT